MKNRGLFFVFMAVIICSYVTAAQSQQGSNLERAQPVATKLANYVKAQKASHNEVDPNHEGTTPAQEDAEVEEEESGHHTLTPSDPQFWENVALALFLTCVGAFCSGMGVGLLSISKLQLNMMLHQNNQFQKKKAQRILSVVNHHHLFLVTLLIANAIGLESLPLVIHTFMPDWLAIITSTVIVLIAAQIIPQAFCTGPNKIMIAYYACPIIYWMIRIFWIVGYPTAKLLDYLVGDDHDEKIQHKDFGTFLNQDKFLNKTQKLLLTSTLDLRGDRVKDAMINVRQFFMLQQRQKIDKTVVNEIIQRDYSYILVYKDVKSNIIGTIKVKQFAIKYLQSDKNDIRAGQVMHYTTQKMLTVYQDTNLLEMLMLFQAKSTRFALVVNARRKIDKDILSIMYTKGDMIYKDAGAEVIGVVFLYQIFNEMAQIRQKKINMTDRIIHQGEPNRDIEMNTLNRNLLQ